MSRDEIEKFQTDEGRAKVEQFMADSADEDDDVDMDKVVRQNLADHAVAMGDGIEAGAGEVPGPFRDDLRSQLVTAGTVAAEQWLTDRANRKMSDVNRRRLAGHVVNALWAEIENAALEIAQYVGDEQLAIATERAVKAEAEVERLQKANHDLAKYHLARMSRATEAEDALAELHERIDASYQWAVQLGPEIRNHTIFVAGSEAEARQMAETTVGRSPETYLIRRCNHEKHGWVTVETLDRLEVADDGD